MVVHTYNLSYMGGRSGRIMLLGQFGSKNLGEPLRKQVRGDDTRLYPLLLVRWRLD
jgi:hypothetical protein